MPSPPSTSNGRSSPAQSVATPATSSLSHHLAAAAASGSTPRTIKHKKSNSSLTAVAGPTASTSVSSVASARRPTSILRPASPSISSTAPPATSTTTATNTPASTVAVSLHPAEEERIWKSPAARKAERKWKRQSEKTLASDPRFRKYAATVDRALASFEAVNEWADFVGALARLEKIFAAPPPLPTSLIPNALLLAKRLSQCLNPALPSGVHHRALSVYRQIFLFLSLDGLRRDLTIWSPALLPFFERSNTSTRPAVLGLLEDFFLPLKEDLKPITRPFLLAVLPGLEEEGAENFDRTLKLLDGLERCVDKDLFWRCLWAAVIGNPAVGQAAVHFLNKRTPPISPELRGNWMPDASEGQVRQQLPPRLSLMPRALSALLSSPELLTIRGGLDLLLQLLPLDTMLYHSLPSEDRRELMQSAIGVVRRRELSLNRRLWSWLGGTGRSSDGQSSSARGQDDLDSEEQELAYLRRFGLADLKEAVLVDLRACCGEQRSASPSGHSDSEGEDAEGGRDFATLDRLAAAQRPLRIFLALLDKWSVGAALTETAILDVWAALRTIRLQLGAEATRDLMTTAAMLFDAIDKSILTRRLVEGIEADFEAGTTGSVDLVLFLVEHFGFRDDPSKAVHLPHLLLLIVDRTERWLKKSAAEQSAEKLAHTAIKACHAVLEVFDLPPPEEAGADGSEALDLNGAVKAFYDSQNAEKTAVDLGRPAVQQALLDGCTDLFKLAETGSPEARQLSTPVLGLCALLFRKLAAAEMSLEEGPDQALSLPSEWILAVLSRASSAPSFKDVDAALRAVDAAATCPQLAPKVDLLSVQLKTQTCLLYAKTVDFLQPSAVAFHGRAVELFWLLESHTASSRLLQTLLCAGLLSNNESELHRSLEAFGVLWRLSDASMLSSQATAAPLSRILDMLKSTDQARRQAGETWLRTNIRSYAPIFDLLLESLRRAEGSARRAPWNTTCAEGVVVSGLAYRHVFDHALVNHWLAVLLATARYGAGGFVRAATSASPSSPTYMEQCLDIMLRLLRTDAFVSPAPATFRELNASTHALCVDVLQYVASKNGLSPSQLAEVEPCLLERLLVSISEGTSARQHRMLLTLHTVITSKAAFHPRSRDVSGSVSSTSTAAFGPHALLLRTLRAGLNQPSPARSTLPHWADFVLMTLPQYRRSMTSLLVPLNSSVCKSIAEAEGEMRGAFNEGGEEASASSSSVRDDDLVMLINICERIVLLCLDEDGDEHAMGHRRQNTGSSIAQPPPAMLQAAAPSKRLPSGSPAADEPAQQQQQPPQQTSSDSATAAGGVGIFGYVTGIFGGDSTPGTATPAGAPPTSSSVLALQLCLRTLHSLWVSLDDGQAPQQDDERIASFRVLSGKARQRSRRFFERVYKSQPSATLETFIDCWSRATGSGAKTGPRAESVFEILDLLAPGHQSVVTFVCDLLAQRLPSPGTSRPQWTPNQLVSEAVLIQFLEVYLGRLGSPAEAQGVWHTVNALVKDLIANSTAHKGYLFPALRCLTVLGEKLASAPAATAAAATTTMTSQPTDDRRMRREMQESYIKLFDLCVLIAGRSFESTNWINARGGGDATDEKAHAAATLSASTSLGDLGGSAPTLVDYLSYSSLPALRKIVTDGDKVANCCNNAIYYIVSPPLRIKNAHRSFEHIDSSLLSLCTEIGRTVPPSLKTLRTPLTDAFHDGRFFKMSPRAGRKWRGPIQLLYATDRDRYFLADVVGRISASASANFFTNREAEIVARSTSLRRLSFVLFSGTRDQFLAQLPQVQEKLVDVLRASPMPDRVAAEAYLCLRVMLLRFQTRHLTTLWPIIITELVRLFEGCTSGAGDDSAAAPSANLPADGSDGVHLIVAACKFIDALLCLRTPEFQVHQWLFVNDADLAGDEFGLEEGLFDRLAGAIEGGAGGASVDSTGRRSAGAASGKGGATAAGRVTTMKEGGSDGSGRQPLLMGMRGLNSLEALVPFLREASGTSFQRSIAGAPRGDVDWAAMDGDVLADLFGG